MQTKENFYRQNEIDFIHLLEQTFGIGNTTIDYFNSIAKDKKISLYDSFLNAHNENLRAGTLQAIQTLIENIKEGYEKNSLNIDLVSIYVVELHDDFRIYKVYVIANTENEARLKMKYSGHHYSSIGGIKLFTMGYN